jgi:hypothetical protein
MKEIKFSKEMLLLAYQIGWRDGELQTLQYGRSINADELNHRALTWLKMQIDKMQDEESQGSVF